MFDVGVRVESLSGLAAETAAGTAGRTRATATLAFGGGATGLVAAPGLVADATSPALVFRAEPVACPAATLFATALVAAVVAPRSSDVLSTQPSRETRTHPAGASPAVNDTVVPASSDATLRAAATPRARSIAGFLPTRSAAVLR